MIMIRVVVLGCILAFSLPLLAAEKIIIMGAGPSTAVASLFFEHFAQTPVGQAYVFEVAPRSIKHAGGLKASGQHLFGRTGRPLTKSEKALGKEQIFLARIPLAIVVGDDVGVRQISLGQLEKIVSREIVNWQQVGGNEAEIVLAGRESTEAAFSAIKNQFDFFRRVEFDEVFQRDHQMVNFLKSTQGRHAIGFGARSSFQEHNILDVTGFSTGLSLGLVYDLKNEQHKLVKSVKAYAKSSQWHEQLLQAGFYIAK